MRVHRGASLHEIERVYRARLDDFVRVARAITGEPEAARDAVQDAFATAVRRRSSYRGDGPLDGWLWRTVVNKARDASRHRVPPDTPPHPNGHGPEPDSDVRAAL